MSVAAVIRHLAFEDLGNLEAVLVSHGYDIHYYEAGVDDLSPLSDEPPALLVVLGGPIGAYETGAYPVLDIELDLLRDRLRDDLPTLGICLGAQLMASALGARVYPGNGKEIGWSPLTLSETGAGSCLSPLVHHGVEVLHWHGDTFDIPEGAIHLAASERYRNQAFSWGKNGLALQFHPEVTAAAMERWFIGHATEIAQTEAIDVPALRAATVTSAPALQVAARKLWARWLGDIGTIPDAPEAEARCA